MPFSILLSLTAELISVSTECAAALLFLDTLDYVIYANSNRAPHARVHHRGSTKVIALS